MPATKDNLQALANDMKRTGSSLMSLGYPMEGMDCIKEANELLQQIPSAPAQHEIKPWQLAWCISNHVQPEQFLRHWHGGRK